VVGDHAAFTAFYCAAFPGLVAFLLYYGAPLADAAEMAQETMTDAFRAWPEIKNPRAWVRTVAGRKLTRRLAAVEETPTESVPEPTPLLPATLDTAEWEQRHEILRLLRLLPSRQRQVMAWTLDGYTPAEIADILGLEPAAVRQNLRRARTQLAAHLHAARGEDARHGSSSYRWREPR
jgi:RNA polymerase sigma-70 factor (ECF subfamily)